MYEQISEAAVHLFVKASILISALFFSFSASLAENTIDKAFEMSFSIGLLVVFLIYMYLENTRKTKQRDRAQEKIEELLCLNIKAMETYSASNRDISKATERAAETQARALESLTTVVDKLRDKQ